MCGKAIFQGINIFGVSLVLCMKNVFYVNKFAKWLVLKFIQYIRREMW